MRISVSLAELSHIVILCYFYLWSKDLFWNTVTSDSFENDAKEALIKALSDSSGRLTGTGLSVYF